MNEGYSKSKALAQAQAQRSSHNCEPPRLPLSCNPEHYILINVFIVTNVNELQEAPTSNCSLVSYQAAAILNHFYAVR